MASGIYRLTFESGKYYIGKSIDIDTRWKQHFNKFALGKAARPMQLEFDRCGPPKTEVIFHCHRDHIDLLEEWLIDQFKGLDMLNTTYPDIARTPEVCELIETHRELLKLSTWDHLRLLGLRDDMILELENDVQDLKDDIELLKSEGLGSELEQAWCEVDALRDLYTEATTELQRLKKLGFWQRLFRYSVNV